MILVACFDIRPGRKASDDLLSVPTTWVGHPILYSLCGESRQTCEEARPFSVAALASGPVLLSSGSHQVAPSLRRSSAADRESHYAVFSRAPSGTTPNSRKHLARSESPQLDQQLPGEDPHLPGSGTAAAEPRLIPRVSLSSSSRFALRSGAKRPHPG